MQYQGLLFNKDFPKGRKSGSLTIQPDRITFSSDDYQLSLPLRRIEIKSGGTADRLIYFKNPADPEISLCTSDRRILKDHNLNLDPDCNASITRLKKNKRKSHAITFVTLVVLAVLISLPFIFSDAIAGFAAKHVPFRIEKKFGEMAFKTVTANKPVLRDKSLNNRLTGIASPIVEIAKQSNPKLDFEFYIVEDPSLNAFALPGGKVVVHSGLLLNAEQPEEIAALLAHEIAHVTCRHHIRQALKNIGISDAIKTIIGNSPISEKMGTYANSMLVLKHSRNAEFQADATAQRYLRQAGINPDGFIELLNRLKNSSQASTPDALSILSTHPPTDKRIEKLAIENTRLPENKEYYKFDVNFKEFQNNLANALK